MKNNQRNMQLLGTLPDSSGCEMRGRVYGVSGTSPTLNTMQGGVTNQRYF